MGALLAAAIPSLVQLVESLFAKKAEPTGTNKQDAVLQMVRALIEKAIATGLPGAPAPGAPQPADDAIRAVIDTVVEQLKATGQLSAQGVGDIYLLRGTVSRLSFSNSTGGQA